MKKSLLLFAVTAIALVGCKKETCGTTDYIIINRIESDITVELKFGEGDVITIEPGKTSMIHHNEWCRDANVALSMTPEILNAEMIINGAVISRYIWWHDYWDVDADIENHYSTYTLTVTDELLETVKNHQE